MIKNKNFVGVLLTFLLTALLLFTAFIPFSYIPTKADELPSFERYDNTKCRAQNIAENTEWIGFHRVNYWGYENEEGFAWTYYIPLDFVSYADENEFGVSFCLYGEEFLDGFFILPASVYNEYDLSGDYIAKAEELNLVYGNGLSTIDTPVSVKEIYDSQTSGGLLESMRVSFDSLESKFSIEDASSTQFVVIEYFYDVSTGTRYYMDPHFVTPNLLSTNNDTVDLSKYISIEESNNKLADKQSEIDKLKTEIEQLKKGTTTENSSSNVFMIVSLAFVLILVVAVISALLPKNKMRK